LVGLYWHETITASSIKVNTFLNEKTRWVFFFFVAIVVTFHSVMTTIIISVGTLRDPISRIMGITFALLGIATPIFLAVSVIRVLVKISQVFQKATGAKKTTLNDTWWFTMRVLLTCVGLLLFSEGVIIFGATLDTVIPIQVFAQTSVAISMAIVSSTQSYSLWRATFKKFKKSSSSTLSKAATKGSDTKGSDTKQSDKSKKDESYELSDEEDDKKSPEESLKESEENKS